MAVLPVLVVCGPAGSGKSTVAEAVLEARPGSVAMGFADPFKRFCKRVFGFSNETLWGPSALREVPDERYADPSAWRNAHAELHADYNRNAFEKDIGTDPVGLQGWFNNLLWEHMADEYEGQGEYHRYFNLYSPSGKIVPKKPFLPRRPLQTIGSEWGRAMNPDLWVNAAVETAFKLLAGGHSYTKEEGLVEDRAATPAPWVVIADGRFPNEPLRIKRAGGAAVAVMDPDARRPEGEVHASERLDLIPRNRYDAVVVNRKADGLHALQMAVRSMIGDLESGYGRYSSSTWNY